jgi:hypothetical protein
MNPRFIRTNLIVACCACALTFLAVNCSTDSLTRDKANRIITQHYKFPYPVAELTLPESAVEGTHGEPGICVNSRFGADPISDKKDVDRVLSILDSLGYARTQDHVISLTEKGKSLSEKRLYGGGGSEYWAWDLAFIRLVGIEISGIAPSGDNTTAEVEFVGRYDVSPLATLLSRLPGLAYRAARGQSYEQLGKDTSPLGRVLMKRYDDGWRFEKELESRIP